MKNKIKRIKYEKMNFLKLKIEDLIIYLEIMIKEMKNIYIKKIKIS